MVQQMLLQQLASLPSSKCLLYWLMMRQKMCSPSAPLMTSSDVLRLTRHDRTTTSPNTGRIPNATTESSRVCTTGAPTIVVQQACWSGPMHHRKL
jgi:hypothetical protein